MQETMERSIGPVSLLLTGLGGIIGSGWLFGAWHASKIAGPAAIFAWIIGAIVTAAIALTYAELGTMFPESGGMVRYARYSHGALLGFIAAWANWISFVTIIPIEAVASVEYMASWPYEWARNLQVNGELTTSGVSISTILVVIYFLVNYWGVKLFVKTNAAITVFKFIMPAITIAGLVLSGFHWQNFSLDNHVNFAPYGWSAIFTAVATSGIVFSFNGFQNPIGLAGEVKNPAKSLPFAIIGSILIALVIYVLLQIAFIGAVDPHSIVAGWHLLNFKSPFAELAIALNLNWLAILLYLDAVVSPSGTGAITTATSARMLVAMERNNTMPRIFGEVHPIYGAPRSAMWLNLIISFIFLYIFRGWGAMAGVISVAVVISFLAGPVSVMALRTHADDINRPVNIPGMRFIAPFAFVCASLVLYWARWPLTGQVILLVIAALPVYFYYQNKTGWSNFRKDIRSAFWIMAYLPAMAVLSLLGSKEYGGIGIIPSGIDMLSVAISALLFYFWGVRSGRRTVYLNEFTTAVNIR